MKIIATKSGGYLYYVKSEETEIDVRAVFSMRSNGNWFYQSGSL